MKFLQLRRYLIYLRILRLIKSLKDINLKGSNRIIEYEFKIDSSVVNIQNGNGFKAYTMFMQTEKPTNDFKNLVIKIYNDF